METNGCTTLNTVEVQNINNNRTMLIEGGKKKEWKRALMFKQADAAKEKKGNGTSDFLLKQTYLTKQNELNRLVD